MHAVKNVLIVGAGMCGMSLGVALRRAGINCEIVEIRPELTELGTGISLQGPALRALQTVGVLDQCISRGFGYSYFKACDAMGHVTGTVDLPRLLGNARSPHQRSKCRGDDALIEAILLACRLSPDAASEYWRSVSRAIACAYTRKA